MPDIELENTGCAQRDRNLYQLRKILFFQLSFPVSKSPAPQTVLPAVFCLAQSGCFPFFYMTLPICKRKYSIYIAIDLANTENFALNFLCPDVKQQISWKIKINNKNSGLNRNQN
jgi:hypothetical protein